MKLIGTIGLRQALHELRTRQTVSWKQAIPNWFIHRSMEYTWVPPSRWAERKTSDTIFVFGSGPSVNALSEAQWGFIKQHDSLGLNFAFLTRRPMTYFYLGYEPGSNEDLRNAFVPEVRAIYERSLWYVPTKALCRLLHPRTAPEFFPPRPQLALFDYPPAIALESDRPFRASDFSNKLVYRGVMGIGLQIAYNLGYRRIVLVGVDLNTNKHFFDDLEVMRRRTEWYNSSVGTPTKFESMIPKSTKYRTMDEYYYAVQELFFQPRGIELFVSNPDNMLAPRIPVYPSFCAPRVPV